MKTLPFVDGPNHWKQSKSRDKWTRRQNRAYRMRKQEIEAGSVRTGFDNSYKGKHGTMMVVS